MFLKIPFQIELNLTQEEKFVNLRVSPEQNESPANFICVRVCVIPCGLRLDCVFFNIGFGKHF